LTLLYGLCCCSVPLCRAMVQLLRTAQLLPKRDVVANRSSLLENVKQAISSSARRFSGHQQHVCTHVYAQLLSRFSLACHTHTTVLRPFVQDHPGEPVPKENFWTLWCKGRLTEADTLTVRLGATPSGPTSAHLHQPPPFFTGQMPFLPPNQQCQSTEGN